MSCVARFENSRIEAHVVRPARDGCERVVRLMRVERSSCRGRCRRDRSGRRRRVEAVRGREHDVRRDDRARAERVVLRTVRDATRIATTDVSRAVVRHAVHDGRRGRPDPRRPATEREQSARTRFTSCSFIRVATSAGFSTLPMALRGSSLHRRRRPSDTCRVQAAPWRTRGASSGVERLARAHDDARDDAVAPRLVGHADDGDLRDRRVLAQGLLDLERAELVAAALQDVDARAPEDAGSSRASSRATVSPVLNQPSHVNALGVASSSPEVVAEDARPANPELAGRRRSRVSTVRQRKPDGARAPLAVERVRQADADLRHAEALERDRARDRAPALGERDRERGAAARREAQACVLLRPRVAPVRPRRRTRRRASRTSSAPP